ncbi:unnamed protein product, partial [Pelagomonas calceolata]
MTSPTPAPTSSEPTPSPTSSEPTPEPTTSPTPVPTSSDRRLRRSRASCARRPEAPESRRPAAHGRPRGTAGEQLRRSRRRRSCSTLHAVRARAPEACEAYHEVQRRRGGGDAAPVAQPLSRRTTARTRSERTGHAVRSGLEAPLAPRSRCSRRPLDGQRSRVPPPPHQRSQRRCQAPPLAGARTAYKAHRTMPGAPGHNATARSRHRSRRSQRRIDAPHESAQESRCCSSMAADCCRARAAGTGRLDLKVQNGTVPELQIRWGVVIWGSQFSPSQS